jgi:hypothetical protein
MLSALGGILLITVLLIIATGVVARMTLGE